MTAYIGYENILDLSVSNLALGTTTELAENPFSNAHDGNLYDSWMPGISGQANAYFSFSQAQSADYIAIYGHNLSGKLVRLFRWTGSSWSTVHSFTPSSNEAVFERFSESTDTDWRITIDGAAIDTFVITIAVGKALQLNPLRAPFSPPPLAGDVEIINNESVENNLLGRVVRDMPFDLRIDQTLVAPEWIDQHSKALVDAINRKPFFFSWDDQRSDACIAWTDRPVAPPRFSRFLFQDFSIRAKGYR